MYFICEVLYLMNLYKTFSSIKSTRLHNQTLASEGVFKTGIFKFVFVHFIACSVWYKNFHSEWLVLCCSAEKEVWHKAYQWGWNGFRLETQIKEVTHPISQSDYNDELCNAMSEKSSSLIFFWKQEEILRALYLWSHNSCC